VQNPIWAEKVFLEVFKNKSKCFAQSTAGTVGLAMALATPVLLLAVGVAVDTARMSHTQSSFQGLVDNAVLAAAQEFQLGTPTDTKMAQISHEFILASMTGTHVSGVTLKNVDAKIDKERSTLTIHASVEQQNYFGGFLNPPVTTFDIETRVQVLAGAKLCVLALEPSAGEAVMLTDSARIDANDCSVQANSKNSKAISVWNSAKVTAEVTCSVGGVASATGAIRPTAVTDCPAIVDPLASRLPPQDATGGCDYNWLKISAEKKRLSPGVYCGGIDIAEGADVKFDPGVYIIRGGVLQASNGSKMTGDDVGFYFSNDAVFKFNTESIVALSGRETGDMNGLLFFADRNSAPRIHQVNSRNANKLVGTIYMPNDTLQVATDASVADDSAYTAIIARRVMLNQSPKLVLQTNYSNSSVPVPEGVGGVVGAVIIE
jgi:Flp pilus assembly protein TadG